MTRRKQSQITAIKNYSKEEALQIANDLINWLHESDQNLLVDDFLLNKKKIFKNDVDYLSQQYDDFKKLIDQANAIELTKLIKFCAADKLNASVIVVCAVYSL